MHDRIPGNRQLCAVLWLIIFALAIATLVFEARQPAPFAIIGGLVVALVTLVTSKFEPEEWLARPTGYRVVVGAWLAVALAGTVLGLLPNASGASRFFAVYFGAVAVLAYRAVVARGPRRAVSGAVSALLLWFPIALFLLTGHEDEGPLLVPPHWTEAATFLTLRILVLMLPIVAAAALVTFVPRHDQVPGARLVRDNR